MLGTGAQIGRYEIRRRLAYGGMGTLYLAHDPVLDRTVALKLFHADLEGPDARERFVREARAVAALNNPNIVTIYDYGEYSSQPFLVMEHIDGETLAVLIRRRPALPTIVKVRWMEDLCSAVGYAHERGIVHRDIKPANLMIDAYGRIKVLDFGIARMRGTLSTNTTGLVGTPGYIAPEQFRGSVADRRSDVFSIGVVCYELFSYVEPFGSGTTFAMSHRIVNDDPVPLDVVQPGLPRDLSALVARALVKDPEQRFATAEMMRDALAGVRRYLESTEPVTISVSGASLRDLLSSSQSHPPEESRSAAMSVGAGPSASSSGTSDPPKGTPARRTTREGLARQREEQLRGWIQLAREHLADGEIADAREACAQALKLEPAHAETLELLGSIGTDSGHARREAGAIRPPVASGLTESFTSTSTIATPVTIPAPSAAGRPQPRASRVPSTKQIGIAAAALVAVLVVAATIAWLASGRATPPPAPSAPVLVVIDASPWATIRGIRKDTGEAHVLPQNASTPLAVSLTPGSYSVSLIGPPPASELREVALRVDANASPKVYEPFHSMTADDYIRDIVRTRNQRLEAPGRAR